MVKNLRSLRESRGLSQEKLAELTGISKARIYTYETKTREPDIEGLIVLSDFFDVTIDYLVGRDEAFYSQKSAGLLGLDRLGDRLQNFRLQRGLNKKELAAKVGISDTYLGFIESGIKIPKLETCLKLLNALEVSADAVFMDSLIAGNYQKTNYLDYLLKELPLEAQQIVLTAVEGMAKSLRGRIKN